MAKIYEMPNTSSSASIHDYLNAVDKALLTNEDSLNPLDYGTIYDVLKGIKKRSSYSSHQFGRLLEVVRRLAE